MGNQPRVCIIGSINMDLTVTTDQIPAQGETVLGNEFFTNPGGKGANQAVAAAKMGADVTMIGAVGPDAFGETLRTNLEEAGVHTLGIETVSGTATGTATIILSENDNRIIVAPGANNRVTRDVVKQHEDVIKQSDIVLLQLEVPMDTVAFTVELAEAHGIPVMLNPAPFQQLPENVLRGAVYLTPNDIEMASMKEHPMFEAIREKLIVTRGAEGVSFVDKGISREVSGYYVPVRDTTGAGDTFNGVLVSELAGGAELEQAIITANAAAALSVSQTGAQGGMPARHDVLAFLTERGHI